ncbi:DUF2513 domain-containing protein [Fructilactobacillus cliffordii]|uniref:DUF2513 domain-containing protein n=1 Tax=Fructilactobacillus cliffordii TaxID=2940299 RepID=UPI0020922027|nr:DUF2513 domain-containing protein [Fructilactobacillus cliffordii]USS86312.1 DUF2513 domain-containing protein [Fructilactobacillus cliffordii]
MKLNHDLVREILLVIEDTDNPSGPDSQYLINRLNKNNNWTYNEIAYTIGKLKEARFIDGDVTWGDNMPLRISPGNLTYYGHKFLDNIRDNNVWRETKKIVSGFSSVSLGILSNVSAGVITELIKRNL